MGGQEDREDAPRFSARETYAILCLQQRIEHNACLCLEMGWICSRACRAQRRRNQLRRQSNNGMPFSS